MSASERGRPWWEEAFGEGYLTVYPHRDLASARRDAAGLVRRGLENPVLDLGCGFGRHVQALRELGVEAFGLDLSAELLAHAGELRGAHPKELPRVLTRGRLVRGDLRRLPFPAGSCGTLLCLFSSFGYLGEEDALVVAEIARVLARGGRLVLDLMNPPRVRSDLVPESRRRVGELEIVERRRLADEGRRVVKEVRLLAPDAERSWREDVRLYETDELSALLGERGLRVLEVHGDFDGSPWSPASARRIVWAGES